MSKSAFLPLSLRGGSTGCLLVHGFTSCPLDVRPLTKHLHRNGFTVREVLLPGHGSNYQDMETYGAEDWLAAVEAELAKLQGQCPQVWIVGFSMGGTLATLAAASNSVQGLVSIAAPIWIWPRRARYAGILRFFQKYAELGKGHEFRFPSWRYERVAVKNIADLNSLIRIAKATYTRIQVPTLIVQGSQDRTIEVRSAKYIYNKLPAPDKELRVVEGGGHMLLLEPVSAHVCNLVEHFISSRTGGSKVV